MTFYVACILASVQIAPVAGSTEKDSGLAILEIDTINGKASSFSLTKDGRVLYFVDELSLIHI